MVEDRHERFPLVRAYPYDIEAKVAAVKGKYLVYVNKGRADGVGGESQLIRLTKKIDIKDPETGTVLGTEYEDENTGFFLARVEEHYSVFDGDDQREPSTAASDHIDKVGTNVVIRVFAEKKRMY